MRKCVSEPDGRKSKSEQNVITLFYVFFDLLIHNLFFPF